MVAFEIPTNHRDGQAFRDAFSQSVIQQLYTPRFSPFLSFFPLFSSPFLFPCKERDPAVCNTFWGGRWMGPRAQDLKDRSGEHRLRRRRKKDAAWQFLRHIRTSFKMISGMKGHRSCQLSVPLLSMGFIDLPSDPQIIEADVSQIIDTRMT